MKWQEEGAGRGKRGKLCGRGVVRKEEMRRGEISLPQGRRLLASRLVQVCLPATQAMANAMLSRDSQRPSSAAYLPYQAWTFFCGLKDLYGTVLANHGHTLWLSMAIHFGLAWLVKPARS